MMKMITNGTVNTAVTGVAAIMPFVLPADISKVTVQDKKRQNEGFDVFLYEKTAAVFTAAVCKYVIFTLCL